MKISELMEAQKSAFDRWAKNLAAERKAKEKEKRANSINLSKLNTKIAKYKRPTDEQIWSKMEQVVGNSFPDGDPIDMLGPWIESKGLEWSVLDKVSKKYTKKPFYGYLADMWDDTAADQIHDAKNGHRDDNSPFYTIDKDGNVKATPNPWKSS